MDSIYGKYNKGLTRQDSVCSASSCEDAEGLALQLAETAVRPVLVRAAEDEEKA